MILQTEEVTRYSRQLMLPQFGVDGQERLKSSHVIIVGVGGLGCPAVSNLSAAGVGKLTLIDGDRVDLTNLHRQHLYTTADVGTLKVEAAARHISAQNHLVAVDTLAERLEPSWSERWLQLLSSADLVIDGSDNFATRYLVNETCVRSRVPLCYGSVYRYSGEVATFLNDRSPCYACLHPRPPLPGTTPNCAEGGVLGVLPHLIGTLQATEALKILAGVGEPCQSRVLSLDIRKAPFFREWKFQASPDCRVCGQKSVESPESNSRSSARTVTQAVPEMTLAKIRHHQAHGDGQLIDIRSSGELVFGTLTGSLHLHGRQLEAFLDRPVISARPLVFHCKSGGRSRALVSRLQDEGWTEVYSLVGDWEVWKEHSGDPLISY